MNTRHVVFGAGPLARAVASELLRTGRTVTMVSRRGTSIEGAAALAGDAADPSFAADATRGAAVVYQCAQPPYHRWSAEFPALQESILGATAASRSRLVVANNLYSYGDPRGAVITEGSSERPNSVKGRVRKAMADAALDAHCRGKVEVALSRPSDYFGPGYDVLGDTVFARALAGRPARLVGAADVPHTFSYVPDAGRAMATLGTSELAWGEVWIPPVQPALTQRSLAQLAWQASGRSGSARIQVAGRATLGALGLVSPTLREMKEMLYEFERPFIVDSSKFESTFGVQATPMEDAISATVEYYRARRESRRGAARSERAAIAGRSGR